MINDTLLSKKFSFEKCLKLPDCIPFYRKSVSEKKVYDK